MTYTYLNPVYPHSCPDPFVLKHRGEYWAYCTGTWHDGRCFGILHSRDLVRWQPLDGALAPLPDELLGEQGVRAIHYWAPEVSYDNGSFYMYYSVGDEAHMQIRVAVAERPAGPFVDSGRRLTAEPFAIDAHVFADDDGRRYLFYATDYLDHTHIGTGTARDLLLDPYTLVGHPAPVTRPRYDWHVYDPQRAEKGGVRWHTIEGPFVLKRKGRYYQMFSGGNWQNVSYGVSYATSDRADALGEWEQHADGERVLPILRTLPGLVVGPGHNSVVRGPDNRQLFCVYHRWVAGARALAIDPLDWAGDRMLVIGPSTTPQPAPISPTFADFFDQGSAGGLGPGWERAGGDWRVGADEARQEAAAGVAEARCAAQAPCFTAEVSLRALDDQSAAGSYGITIDRHLFFMLEPARQRITTRVWQGDYGWQEQHLALPPGFDPRAYHLLRVEANLWRIKIILDDGAIQWSSELLGSPGGLALRTDGMRAAFSGFALAAGWQDDFADEGGDPIQLGWHPEGRPGERPGPTLHGQPAQPRPASGWRLAGRQLWCSAGAAATSITKDVPLDAYELVVNVRLVAQSEPQGCYGFYPATRPGARGPLLTIERGTAGWALVQREGGTNSVFSLPADFDPFVYQQFRLRKQAGRLAIAWEAHPLGEIDAPTGPTQIGLYARGADTAFDMVRVTAISA